MSWSTWLDDSRHVHIVENRDVHPMLLGREPNPWHTFGDEACPCQPHTSRDWEPMRSSRRLLIHRDPVQ